MRWKTIDHCNLEQITKPTKEFAEKFCDELFKLSKIHRFIAEQQSEPLQPQN